MMSVGKLLTTTAGGFIMRQTSIFVSYFKR